MTDTTQPPRRRVQLTAILLLVLLPFLLLLAAELAGRLYIHFVYGVPGKSYGIYEYHPLLGSTLRADSYNLRKTFNNRGFQGDEDVPAGDKPEGELRLIAYGGSTTFCYNLPSGEDWPSQLQSQLRVQGIRARMLNAGDVSWSLGHINLRTREEFPGLDADWVVLYSGINEISNARFIEAAGDDFTAAVEAGQWGLIATDLGQNSWLSRHSLVFKAWQRWLKPHVNRLLSVAPPAGQSPPSLAAVDANYQHLLRDLIGYWRNHGAKVLFIIQAVENPEHINARRAEVSRRGAATAAAAGAYVLDAQEVVSAYPGDPGDLFIDSGVHWTREGALRFADYLARNLPFEHPRNAR